MHLVEKEFLNYMKKFDASPFEIEMNGRSHLIGEGKPVFKAVIHKIPSVGDLLTSASITLGEAYMNGEIEIEGDLYNALLHFMKKIGEFSTDRKALKKLFFTANTRHNQKKEVSSHYDLGNDFYQLWLDQSLSYSCAYFKKEQDNLYEAQYNKVHRILEKLYLKEGMTLCDIGCGWGFLLIEAAKKYKVRGVGVTLSVEQKKEFERRIKQEGLEAYLQVELMDYRDISSLNMKFDRAVSVGMVEHVGRRNYPLFMSCVKDILKPGGIFVLHYISALLESPGDAWIKKYIFPGGVIPSLREIIAIAGNLRFFAIDVESLRRHYAQTLLIWNQNFQKCRQQAMEMFDQKFARMWELYLCACAAAFTNGVVDLSQIVFTNDVNNELPITRWY